MSFISESASAIKSRFVMQDQLSESVPSVRSSPALFKTASKENLFQSPAVRSYSERDDHDAVASSHSFDLSEDPSFWKDHNVQVIIRLRPLSSSEISLQGYSRCVRQDSAQTITWTGHPESRFTFDVVADENVSQEMLFKVAGVPMVENCVGGYNSCMFAYGQTGSGKTHTMLGDIEGGTRRHSINCGMTPRVFEYLFSRIQKEKEARKEEKLRFICKCSFLEIYNEQILDLLDPSSTNLQIREDTKKGVYVDNLTEVEVTSARDVLQQLVQGSANRKVAATNMNRASSRSHSVFTCIIESKGVTHYRFARLNLVDLAGSERQKSSGAEGERLKEATNINKSLSTLGLVIMNLVSISNGKSQHVPYRDSKLTFLLQDSLGGNSKTIIIANISPSSCSSLETLSTLKFAQRAKFIKNHAIVNEDASGDVLAMRVQIQQLKKEVARLKGLANGGVENHESDAWTVSVPGSPGSFKWDGLYGSFSPLMSDKRVSQKKEFEVALVGAFRREKDKDITLQALTAENQAAMQLAKQRGDEIQGLKMRLRFREAGIKRLEAVASGKISAEMHLLKEKEEHLKEIDVLRAQVDRNQEVTRFAMENLRLKEEIRRLKSFYEEGERERMNEQIVILQNKLLEALDWKLMHESDLSIVQKGNSDLTTDILSEGNLLVSSQESGSPWRTLVNEENEFLRLQAIQNQSEIDSLRKKLSFCLEEKEKLERKVNELVNELEAERSSKEQGNEMHKMQIELSSLSTDQMLNIYPNDQSELKAMVDAIAAASQKEAEAHEAAFNLSRENEELRMKIKVLIDDNNKLIELYGRVVSDNTDTSREKVQDRRESETEYQNTNFVKPSVQEELQLKHKVEYLEQQLMEMHEENEKLMFLYEKAMQERDAFKRKLSLGAQNSVQDKGELSCPEKLVEVDKGECYKPDKYLVSQVEALEFENLNITEGKMLVEETDNINLDMHDNSNHASSLHEDPLSDVMNDSAFENDSVLEINSLNLTTVKVSEEMDLVRMKLNRVEEKLLSSVETISLFGSAEKAITEVDNLSREIETLEDAIKVKKQEYTFLKLLSSEIHERRTVVDRKLSALKYSLTSFSSSVSYFEQREFQARTKMNASLSHLDRKKEQLAFLEAKKNEYIDSQRKFQQLEVELTNNLAHLTTKLQEENQIRESEKVLFAIDNIEKKDALNSQKTWVLNGKATELLKSQEEKTKIKTEMTQTREELETAKLEYKCLDKKIKKVENEMQAVQMEIEKASKSVEEMDLKLRDVSKDKEMLLEMKENGSTEVQNMIAEYHQHTIEAELKEEEIAILDEEIKMKFDRVSELQKAKLVASETKSQLMGVIRPGSCLEEIQDIRMSVLEMKSLLGDDS